MWKNRLAVAALLLLTIGFYWKIALTDQYVWFDHPHEDYFAFPGWRERQSENV